MSTKHASESDLREFYAAESARIRAEFSARSDGRAAVNGRSTLVDSIALRLWKKLISPDTAGPQNLALVALGGYGRRWLFPYSDIDILFLHAGGGAERNLKGHIAQFSQEIWDLRLKLSQWCDAAVQRTTADIESLEMHSAVRNLMRLLERIKDFEKRVLAREPGLGQANLEALLGALSVLVQMLGPFVPHLAEDLWLQLGNEEQGSQTPWPGVSFKVPV